MQIAHILVHRSPGEVITIDAEASVADAVKLLAEKRIGAMPVLANGSLAGIFSERDVLYRLAHEGSACLGSKVGDVMTSPAITVEKSARADEALGLMTRRRIRHLPVTENGAMCGFVSIGDLVKSRIVEVEHEAEALKEYIAHG